MSSRAITYPERPQIRISSTFFWHLSSDVDLAPIPELARQAALYAGPPQDQPKQPIYEKIKVGKQVEKYVTTLITCCVAALSEPYSISVN